MVRNTTQRVTVIRNTQRGADVFSDKPRLAVADDRPHLIFSELKEDCGRTTADLITHDLSLPRYQAHKKRRRHARFADREQYRRALRLPHTTTPRWAVGCSADTKKTAKRKTSGGVRLFFGLQNPATGIPGAWSAWHSHGGLSRVWVVQLHPLLSDTVLFPL